jgi:ribosome-associated heat shock protein Hsp15
MSDGPRVRLDVWLDVACLFPTRSQARLAIDAGHVRLGGEHVKPARAVQAGDVVELRSPGRVRTFVVRAVRDRHVPRAEARTLYDETTPRPSPEEIEMRRAMRAARVLRPAGAGRPTKRDRRRTDRLRGG